MKNNLAANENEKAKIMFEKVKKKWMNETLNVDDTEQNR